MIVQLHLKVHRQDILTPLTDGVFEGVVNGVGLVDVVEGRFVRKSDVQSNIKPTATVCKVLTCKNDISIVRF
jgi:hypothetical protein